MIQGFRIGGGLDEEAALLAKREEWKRIEPLLPRGRRGAHRVDDRRVISGIVHMLRSGARWRDCPPEYGPYTTIYNRFNRWSRQGLWFEMFEALTGSERRYRYRRHRQLPHQGAPLGGGRKRGALGEAIGRSRGGRTTKIHALTDAIGRPRVVLLSPGNVNDIAMAPDLIAAGRSDQSASSPTRPTTPTPCASCWREHGRQGCHSVDHSRRPADPVRARPVYRQAQSDRANVRPAQGLPTRSLHATTSSPAISSLVRSSPQS